MRVAIVSPYSWTFPGGVNRHVESLAWQLLERGHDVRVFAPWDDPGTLTRLRHRAQPTTVEMPDYLVPLGPTFGFGANGSVSNLTPFPSAIMRMRQELDAFAPDVVHLHEPPAPPLCWDACSYGGAPVVGTFHAYSTQAIPNRAAVLAGARRKFSRLSKRIAVSEAAAWTGRRWFGGEYSIIPNGVDASHAPDGPKTAAEELRIVFVGRAEVRKGLPILLSAYEGLVEQVPSRLTIVGPSAEEVAAQVPDEALMSKIDLPGRVSHDRLWELLHEADVLCAPSLAGESFGMILTEAFAAGTPVIASNIAGYADVVDHGVDGILVPPADPQALAEELQRFAYDPALVERLGAGAKISAERYDWANVAAEIEDVYVDAASDFVPDKPRSLSLAIRRLGFTPPGEERPPAPERLPSMDPDTGKSKGAPWRRAGLAVTAVLALALTVVAVQRVGPNNVFGSIVRSDQGLLLAATALMGAAMLVRSLAWHAIARAAMPGRRLRRTDFASATMIGVLMSATLPARLGEPARAVVVSRRIGRVRETLPVILGTMVSQTMLNIAALVILGVLVMTGTELFDAGSRRVFLFSLVPLLLLVAVIVAPVMVRGRIGSGRIARLTELVHSALVQVRRGLDVFRHPRLGFQAAFFQFGAWAVQLASCVMLFWAMGLADNVPVVAAAAAVLFAVNVTAVVPATPANVGVFQLAVIAVLHGAFGVSEADALAYGVILQAVEIGTAVAMGVPALVREGVSWSDMRVRALSTTPVRLNPKPRPRTTTNP